MNRFPLNDKPRKTALDMDLLKRDEFISRLMEEAGLEDVPDGDPDDEESLTPDTFGCDNMFLDFFITERMREDFPLIARDFLLHEYSNIKDHETLKYLDTASSKNYPEKMFERFILNLMMNAVRSGSLYTKNLFLYLYKVYYRKEYQQLKRFKRLSYDDVVTLADTGDYTSYATVARILSIAGMYGIELLPDCDLLYMDLNLRRGDDEVIDEKDRKFEDDVIHLYKECLEEAEKLFENEDEMYSMFYEQWKYVENVLRSEGYIEDMVDLCDDEYRGVRIEIGRSLAVLRKTYKGREFSKEELISYAALYHAVDALMCSIDETENWLRDLLYIGDRSDYYEFFTPLFKPEEVMNSWPGASSAVPAKKEKERKTPEKETEKPQESREEALIAEMEALRRKIHMHEGDIRELRSELADKRRVLEENVNLKEQLDSQSRELAALREHLYNMTEEDEKEDTVSVSEMKDFLRPLRIMIIGGHSNWLNKMKSDFPDWVYINPTVSGTLEASVVDRADRVYFFTDTISHSTYFKYMNIVKDHNVAFGYIHGVNIENTVRQMYRELKVKE